MNTTHRGQTASHIFGQKSAPQAAAMSGSVERQLIQAHFAAGRHQDNLTFCLQLSQRYPLDGFVWKMLAATLYRMGRLTEALEPAKRGAVMLANDHEAFNNLGAIYQQLGQADFAAACFEQALNLRPNDPDCLRNMTLWLLDAGRQDDALTLLRRWAHVCPDDGYVQHMVATLSGDQTDQAPAGYVTQLFNQYADTFDEHLAHKLGYKAPQQLADLLCEVAAPAAHSLAVLDLGCGTGLTGEAIAPWSRALVGVDLSPRMIERARARGCYTALIEADIGQALASQADQATDLVLAADVFIYVGRFEPVLRDIHRTLKPGAYFAFSVESLPESAGREVQLERSGRYSHALSHLTRLADSFGFQVQQVTDVVLRQDTSGAIAGHLCLWRKAPTAN